MRIKIKDSKKVKGGYQSTFTDSDNNTATSDVWADEADADSEATRRLQQKRSKWLKKNFKKKKPASTNDNESSINPKLYGDMLGE